MTDVDYYLDEDGLYRPAEPLPMLEEHTRLERFFLWLLRRPHCGRVPR